MGENNRDGCHRTATGTTTPAPRRTPPPSNLFAGGRESGGADAAGPGGRISAILAIRRNSSPASTAEIEARAIRDRLG